MTRLRVLVVGCGVMGARHARVVAADPECDLVTHDHDPDRARIVADQHGGRAVDRIPADLDLAVVATPATTHRAVAGPLLARGVRCLVEKPLADTLAGARLLAGPRCSVGHSERFNPAIRAVGRLEPVEVTATRSALPGPRGRDVDVVLDLMIHDLDLIGRWFAGDPLEVRARGDQDQVRADLRFAAGWARLGASRIADRPVRRLDCVEAGRRVELDLAAAAIGNGPDALTLQWRAFRDLAARDLPDPDPGLRAMELADRIRRALG